jgi:hypothetical protein
MTETKEEKPHDPIPEKPKTTDLSDRALEQVSGGTGEMQDITLNKAKAGQKAADKADAYIRS